MKWTKLSFIGIAVYFLALFVTLPASQVFSWVKPKQVAMYEMSGTPWSGQAKVAVLSGIHIENINWNLRILPLILGRLQYTLTIPFGKESINIDLGKGLTGTTYIHNINGTIPFKEALDLAKKRIPNARYIEGQGDIKLEDVNIQFTDSGIRNASGEIKWVGAKLTILDTLDLNEIKIKLESEENKLKIFVSSSTKSVIDISGVLSLSPSGNYQFKGKLAERKNIGLKQILGNRYRKGRDGKYSITYKGKISI